MLCTRALCIRPQVIETSLCVNQHIREGQSSLVTKNKQNTKQRRVDANHPFPTHNISIEKLTITFAAPVCYRPDYLPFIPTVHNGVIGELISPHSFRHNLTHQTTDQHGYLVKTNHAEQMFITWSQISDL